MEVCPFSPFAGKGRVSLREGSPIWAAEASRARTRERAAKPRGAGSPVSRFRVSSRAFTFHDIPQMESLLAGKVGWGL